jgi:glycosyltransferase EpsH
MNNDLISIIIPVYNAESHLSKCLNSIIHQSYQNLEIICVDDGSTDNSHKILTNYAIIDRRFKIIKQKNSGASIARNIALDNVTGKYIMFVDSDDYLELNACEIAISTAQKNNADLIFWSYVREFTNQSKEKHFFWDDGEIFEEGSVKNLLHRRLVGPLKEELAHPDYLYSFEPLWNKMYRSDYILKNNIKFTDIKQISTSEDGIFNLHALKYVTKAVYIKKCLYHYNKTNVSSITSNYKPHLFIQWLKLFEIIKNYIIQNNLPQCYYEALNNRIALSVLFLGLNILQADSNLFKKIQLISRILYTSEYKHACKQLKLKYFPLHWKIFFLAVKLKFSFGIYLILIAITILQNK